MVSPAPIRTSVETSQTTKGAEPPEPSADPPAGRLRLWAAPPPFISRVVSSRVLVVSLLELDSLHHSRILNSLRILKPKKIMNLNKNLTSNLWWKRFKLFLDRVCPPGTDSLVTSGWTSWTSGVFLCLSIVLQTFCMALLGSTAWSDSLLGFCTYVCQQLGQTAAFLFVKTLTCLHL